MAKNVLHLSPNSSYRKSRESKYTDLLKEGVWAGFGWAMGVTLGFAIITIILGFALRSLGGTPVVGGWIANIVEATQLQLESKTQKIIK